MKDLILLVGSLQSGKTSTAAAIMGHYLTSKGIVPNFNVKEDKKHPYILYDKGMSFEFDIETQDPDIQDWYSKTVWPHVMNASFATKLKDILMNFFGLSFESVYGTNEEKNAPTHLLTANFLTLIDPQLNKPEYEHYRERVKQNKDDCLSGREAMQLFGTDVCRKLYGNCHIESAYKRLVDHNPHIGIIPDGRFSNEVAYFSQLREHSDLNVIIIKLLRAIEEPKHDAERAAFEVPDEVYDLIVDNTNLTIHEKNMIVIEYLISRKVLTKTGLVQQSKA